MADGQVFASRNGQPVRPVTCLRCGTPLDVSYVVRPGRSTFFRVWPVVCSRCCPLYVRYMSPAFQPKPCTGCGRPTVYCCYGGRRFVFCSDACRAEVEQAQRTPRSAKCEACSEVFSPRRSDARYCSSACRQWAYRARRR